MSAPLQPECLDPSGHPTGGEARLALGFPTPPSATADRLVQAALQVVLRHGHTVSGERPFTEVIDQQLVLQDPRHRVVRPGRSTFSLRVAVARFIWHLAASSDLEHIAYYEPRAREFSDDGQVLPGSNVGARILGAASGVDQFQGAIKRLRADPTSRRAAVGVWEPRDAVRTSRDIPCTSGMTFHVRAGQLIMTTTMRSNNALRLLPYNVFELSMLGELASALLQVSPGPYVHLVNSLHVFDDELDAAAAVLEDLSEPLSSQSMPPMPAKPDPLDAIRKVIELERRCRTAIGVGARRELEAVLSASARDLPSYWHVLVLVLATRDASRRLVPGVVERTVECLEPRHPFLAHLKRP